MKTEREREREREREIRWKERERERERERLDGKRERKSASVGPCLSCLSCRK